MAHSELIARVKRSWKRWWVEAPESVAVAQGQIVAALAILAAAFIWGLFT